MTDAAAAADLMFRPATELAALVRSGEITARELVEASLSRIDALNPSLQRLHRRLPRRRARRGRRDRRPATSARSPACRSRSRTTRPVEGKRLTFCLVVLRRLHRARRRASSCSACATAGSSSSARRTLPEFGILLDDRAAPLRRDAQPVGHRRARPAARPAARRRRSPRAWCRSRTATTAAARSASPPPAAGSSGSSPSAGASRRRRSSASRSSASTASSARTDAGDGARARRARRAGARRRDVGAAAGRAVRRAAAAREPGKLRIAMTHADADRRPRPCDPAIARGRRGGRRAAGDLGHEVVEVDPPWRTPGLLELFADAVGADDLRRRSAFGAMIAGREPTPRTSSRCRSRSTRTRARSTRSPTPQVLMQLQGVARALVTWTAQYDAVLCPRSPSRRSRSGRSTPATSPTRCRLPARGRLHAVHARRQPHRPAGDRAAAAARRRAGLPIGVQLIGQPADEGALLALSAQLEAARPWADRRAPVDAVTA